MDINPSNVSQGNDPYDVQSERVEFTLKSSFFNNEAEQKSKKFRRVTDVAKYFDEMFQEALSLTNSDGFEIELTAILKYENEKKEKKAKLIKGGTVRCHVARLNVVTGVEMRIVTAQEVRTIVGGALCGSPSSQCC